METINVSLGSAPEQKHAVPVSKIRKFIKYLDNPKLPKSLKYYGKPLKDGYVRNDVFGVILAPIVHFAEKKGAIHRRKDGRWIITAVDHIFFPNTKNEYKGIIHTEQYTKVKIMIEGLNEYNRIVGKASGRDKEAMSALIKEQGKIGV